MPILHTNAFLYLKRKKQKKENKNPQKPDCQSLGNSRMVFPLPVPNHQPNREVTRLESTEAQPLKTS